MHMIYRIDYFILQGEIEFCNLTLIQTKTTPTSKVASNLVARLKTINQDFKSKTLIVRGIYIKFKVLQINCIDGKVIFIRQLMINLIIGGSHNF